MENQDSIFWYHFFHMRNTNGKSRFHLLIPLFAYEKYQVENQDSVFWYPLLIFVTLFIYEKAFVLRSHSFDITNMSKSPYPKKGVLETGNFKKKLPSFITFHLMKNILLLDVMRGLRCSRFQLGRRQCSICERVSFFEEIEYERMQKFENGFYGVYWHENVRYISSRFTWWRNS